MSAGTAPRDWDAATYDRVAAPQTQWAGEVIERLRLRGDETVLDAGCGTGRPTRLLIERLPRGRVIGVDASPSMIELARESLRDDADLLVCDLVELELPSPVDAVFSTATFHWITDHDRLFERLHANLRPGGRLVAQCGGRGNVAEVKGLGREVAAQPRFAAHFKGWTDPWYFAGPDETEERLWSAGFVDVRCWLEDKPTRLAAENAQAFMATVILGPHVDRLPAALHADFVDEVSARMSDPTLFRYVRLNIDATRG